MVASIRSVNMKGLTIGQFVAPPSQIEMWIQTIDTGQSPTGIVPPFDTGLLNPYHDFFGNNSTNLPILFEITDRDIVTPYTLNSSSTYVGTTLLSTTWVPNLSEGDHWEPPVLVTNNDGTGAVQMFASTFTWGGGVFSVEPLSYPGVRTILNFATDPNSGDAYPQISFEYEWATGP